MIAVPFALLFLGGLWAAGALAESVVPPSSLKVPSADRDGTYQVRWGGSSSSGAVYVLEEATAPEFTEQLRTAYQGPLRSVTISRPTEPGAAYYYRVKATLPGFADSEWRLGSRGCLVPGRKLPAPVKIGIPVSMTDGAYRTAPVVDGDGGYLVSWTVAEPAPAGQGYVVEESPARNFATVTRSFTWTGALDGSGRPAIAVDGQSTAAGTTYYYRVKARKAGYKDSSWRKGASVAVLGAGDRAMAPGSLTVPSDDADGTYLVKWKASPTKGASYVLEEARDAAFSVGTQVVYSGPALSQMLYERRLGSTFYYRVKAVHPEYRDSDWQAAAGGCKVGVTRDLWIYVDPLNLPETVTDNHLDLYGKAYCDACPPAEGGFGYCPPALPPTSSAIAVSWENLTNGAAGTAFSGIRGSCGCLFSSCITSYSNRWAAYDVPLTIGENLIEVQASAPGDFATDTIAVTRLPTAPLGLNATAGKGQVTLQWSGVPEATSYNLYWSSVPDATKATAMKISAVASPYVHTGLSDDVTYYYFVTAVNGAYESAASPAALATAGWSGTAALAMTAPTSDDATAAIAVDANGHVHIHYSYNEGYLRDTGSVPYYDYRYRNAYLTDKSGSWSTTSFGETTAVDANLVLSSDGNVHLSYQKHGLTHAVYASGAWTSEVVTGGQSFSALAVDAANHVHLAYDTMAPADGMLWNQLWYAHNAAGAWIAAAVTQDFSPYDLDLVADATGGAHLFYIGGNPTYDLRYATVHGGVWSSSVLDAAGAYSFAAALDGSGALHLAYGGKFGDLRYARRDDMGNWSFETVGSGISGAALAVDAAGHAHISYVGDRHELRYVTNVSGSWRSTILDISSGPATAIAVDGNDKVHIVYFSGGSLNYLTNR